MQIPEFNATNNPTPPPLPPVTSYNTSPPPPKFSNPFKKINPKQLTGLITVLVLVIGIFVTTGMTQNVQKIFTRAFVQPDSYGYGDYGSGSYLGVSVVASPDPPPSNNSSPSASPRKPGDVDGNGLVNIFDFNFLIGDFGQIGENLRSDFNNNRKVDVFDFNILISNFQK